ncbi:MBL fold metallo-hydrolase [Asticcacaulis excentricus]|uniref:Beta-lactamase domain protein n=1 Tax=Asticcacaulis excentricus (strain ATCC 15261 / DSM 4724 / KCTC 12464 / NCIMB 9791 / VKM B-1370 / CB 48) TaxID=573065 RepID=E8RRI9_ASTEC|nr:MBL fold metallo-hydrolase [Asticcacaulis excentricus]ADU13434.1 beta-lactamase domain protein [Asticcacaulis excentricus CB 48]
MKRLIALVTISTLLAGSALAQTAGQVPADATPYTLGDIQLYSLRDMQFVIPNDGKVFGIDAGPQAVAEVLKANNAPTDKITLSVDALLVKDEARLILIDTGVGGVLGDSLKKAGYGPADITDVLISHPHGDHIGGLVKEGKPAFPNAKIRIAEADWAFLKGQANQAALVAAITPQVETFAPGAVITPHVKAVAIEGHTPGHSGYEIASGKDRLLAIGDAAHSSIISLAKPDWSIQFDTDKTEAKQSRRALLTELAKSNTLIFAPHFPYPGLGHVAASKDGFVFVPVK